MLGKGTGAGGMLLKGHWWCPGHGRAPWSPRPCPHSTRRTASGSGLSGTGMGRSPFDRRGVAGARGRPPPAGHTFQSRTGRIRGRGPAGGVGPRAPVQVVCVPSGWAQPLRTCPWGQAWAPPASGGLRVPPPSSRCSSLTTRRLVLAEQGLGWGPPGAGVPDAALPSPWVWAPRWAEEPALPWPRRQEPNLVGRASELWGGHLGWEGGPAALSSHLQAGEGSSRAGGMPVGAQGEAVTPWSDQHLSLLVVRRWNTPTPTPMLTARCSAQCPRSHLC